MKGKEGSSQYFVFTAVIFEDHEDADGCDNKIAELREKCFKKASREFHFSKCCDSYRKEFLEGVGTFDFFYLAFVLNKAKLYGPGFQFKDPFYKYTAKLLFENAKPYLRDAIVLIDRSGNREFRKQLDKYLRGKINTDHEIIKKVKTEPSHSNNLLQLADMVCGAVARYYKKDKKDSGQYRKMIAHRELEVQVWPRL